MVVFLAEFGAEALEEVDVQVLWVLMAVWVDYLAEEVVVEEGEGADWVD